VVIAVAAAAGWHARVAHPKQGLVMILDTLRVFAKAKPVCFHRLLDLGEWRRGKVDGGKVFRQGGGRPVTLLQRF